MTPTYCIVDIETTGLNPEYDDILELGILILDENFDTVDSFEQVAYYAKGAPLAQNIDRVVLDMHNNNGLFLKCETGQNRKQIERDAVRFVASHFGKTAPEMCGNSVHFDRAFLKKHMPFLESMFHYRNIDVSTLKILAKKFDVAPPIIAKSNHRALSDCAGSATELEYYLSKMGWIK